MKIVVVIPTYNEAENIEQLIPELDKEFRKFPQHEFIVLIVDGNSPDGTGSLVQEMSREYPFLQLLLEKEKAGIGAAYIYGFQKAIENLGADVVVEMDGDLQHDPADFPKLIEGIDQGYDYIIGSRYVKGGSIPKEWEFYRKFLSVGGSLFTKVVLGIWNVNDFTTGYKASRVKGFLDCIDLDDINSKGFAYKIDLLYRMHKLGANILEIPIKFGLRDRGTSKMEKDNFLDSLRVVVLLRLRDSLSFIKFLIVGFTGLFVDSALFALLRTTKLGSSYASAVSGFIAMLTTFLFNNYWSFGDRKLKGAKNKIKSLVFYFTSSYIPIVFRSWLIDFSVHRFGDTGLVAFSAFFIGVVVGTVWNYLVYSRLIWKKV